jgi:FMN phosphatase YigB (HAD superfamily)
MGQKLAVWDWTATLANEVEIDKAVCRSMEEEYAQKYEVSLKEAERRFKEHLQSLENTWKWHNYPLHGRVLGIDWRKSQEKNLEKLVVLPNTREILEYVKQRGYKNVLATNAAKPVMLIRVGHAKLLDLFDLVIGSDVVKALKADGKHFEYALKKLNGKASESYSIGDNPVQDIIPAERLGLNTIYCRFGRGMTYYHSEHISGNHSVQPNADYVIDDLLEIKDIIK